MNTEEVNVLFNPSLRQVKSFCEIIWGFALNEGERKEERGAQPQASGAELYLHM